MRRVLESGEKRKRKPRPDQLALLERGPELDAGCMILVRAYAELSTCRPVGMGPAPIPITVMWQWCDRRGVRDPAVVDHFCLVLRLVDAAILRKVEARTPGKHK